MVHAAPQSPILYKNCYYLRSSDSNLAKWTSRYIIREVWFANWRANCSLPEPCQTFHKSTGIPMPLLDSLMEKFCRITRGNHLSIKAYDGRSHRSEDEEASMTNWNTFQHLLQASDVASCFVKLKLSVKNSFLLKTL